MKHFFLSTALLIFTASIQAQLTIGSGQTPEKGALLHLKEHEPDNQNITSTKGLSLPRVALSDKNNLFPMFETVAGNGIANDKYNTLAKKENQDAIHTGLIVYNTSTQINIIKPENTCANVDWSGGSANIILAPGIYVWNGQSWESLMPQESEKNVENKLPSWFGEGVGLLKDIEGNLYTTMDFNSAGTWMTQNLRVKTFDTESGVSMTFPAIPSWGQTSTPNWAYPAPIGGDYTNSYYYDKNPSMGILYNLAGALGVTNSEKDYSKRQGICPNGWYIPTLSEFQSLLDEINSNPTKYTTSNMTGNYNLFANCALGEIGNVSDARSKDFYKGGVAMYYLSWIHMGRLWEMGSNGAVYWCSNIYSSSDPKQTITNIVDSENLVKASYWIDSQQRSQTVVRCKKRE